MTTPHPRQTKGTSGGCDPVSPSTTTPPVVEGVDPVSLGALPLRLPGPGSGP